MDENQENLECAEHIDESNRTVEVENAPQEIPINEFTDDLLLENDDLFAKADEIIERAAQTIFNVEKCSADIPVESDKAAEGLDIEMIEKTDSTAPAQSVDEPPETALDAPQEKEKPQEKSEELFDALMEGTTQTTEDDTKCAVAEKTAADDDTIDDELDIQIIDDSASETTAQKVDENEEEPKSALDAAISSEIEKVAENTNGHTTAEADTNETESTTPMDVDEPALQEKPAPVRRECLNLECPKTSEVFYSASEFIINHFHLSKRPKLTYVCELCHDSVTEHYGELCAALEDKQPLFSKMIKQANLIEVIDSSDEEDDTDSKSHDTEENLFDADTLEMIENDLETVITETLQRIDIDQQMDWNRQLLKTKIESNDRNCVELLREIKALQSQMDTLYTDTYKIRHNFVEEIQSLDVRTMRPVQICNESYPPALAGEQKYPDIAYNTMYYTFRKKPLSRWVPCKVVDMVASADGTKSHYSVRICHETREIPIKTGVLRKHLAYGRASDHRLNIGTRVIALFSEIENNPPSKQKDKIVRNNFYPGVIGEPLNVYTRWRYLVFFDDGYTQYVHHDNVRVVCEPAENVWELIEEPGGKAFVENYIKQVSFASNFAIKSNRSQSIHFGIFVFALHRSRKSDQSFMCNAACEYKPNAVDDGTVALSTMSMQVWSRCTLKISRNTSGSTEVPPDFCLCINEFSIQHKRKI